MATSLPPVATVVTIHGAAFARDADGNTRSLKAGDALREGETLVTSAGGRVELAMADGSQLAIPENQTIAIGAEMDESTRPAAADAQLASADIENVIQALERGGDLGDALEDPAAGLAGGGGGEGNNFVRLLRIAEGVTPLEFEFGILPPDEPPIFFGGPLDDEAETTYTPSIVVPPSPSENVPRRSPSRSPTPSR